MNPDRIIAMMWAVFPVLLVAAMAAFMLLAPKRASPHDMGDGLQAWYQAQLIPGGPDRGKTCCSQSDMVNAETDIRSGQYWAKFCPREKSVPCTDWTLVPDFLIIRPSKNMSPVVWYGIAWDSTAQPQVGRAFIRCFAPGAET